MRAFIGTVLPSRVRGYAATGALLLCTTSAALAQAPLGDGESELAGRDRCIGIPRESETPPVTVCETKMEYVFTVTGERTAYLKEEFRSALRVAVGRWYDEAGVEEPSGARLEFWVAVPEANPAGTMARVALVDGVTTTGEAAPSVVFFVSIDPATWTFTDADVAVLGDERYPEAYGYRVGTLLVKAAPTAEKGQIETFLAGHGVGGGDEFAPNWSAHSVAPFQEEQTAAAVRLDPRGAELVTKVELNQIVEWIARRERAFAFSLGEP